MQPLQSRLRRSKRRLEEAIKLVIEPRQGRPHRRDDALNAKT